MAGTEIEIRTDAGLFAGVTWGETGPDCLLIHGTGQNALAWRALAEILSRTCRIIAFDMRGHGQTPENSTDAEQYWRDIQPVLVALDMRQPILIGQRHASGRAAQQGKLSGMKHGATELRSASVARCR